MKTKRKYAHELYPHPAEGEVRPLAVEVPYLYARAIGLDVTGTSWTDVAPAEMSARINRMIDARRIALLADALSEGLAGWAAWEWATSRANDESGGWTYERAVHHGVDPEAIKPYPCGPEPDHHDHLGEADARGWRTVNRVDGKESECADCCEPETATP